MRFYLEKMGVYERRPQIDATMFWQITNLNMNNLVDKENKANSIQTLVPVERERVKENRYDKTKSKQSKVNKEEQKKSFLFCSLPPPPRVCVWDWQPRGLKGRPTIRPAFSERTRKK